MKLLFAAATLLSLALVACGGRANTGVRVELLTPTPVALTETGSCPSNLGDVEIVYQSKDVCAARFRPVIGVRILAASMEDFRLRRAEAMEVLRQLVPVDVDNCKIIFTPPIDLKSEVNTSDVLADGCQFVGEPIGK